MYSGQTALSETLKLTESEMQRILEDVETQRLPRAITALVKAKLEDRPAGEIEAAQYELARALLSVVWAAKKPVSGAKDEPGAVRAALAAVEILYSIMNVIRDEAWKGHRMLRSLDALSAAEGLRMALGVKEDERKQIERKQTEPTPAGKGVLIFCQDMGTA